MNHKFVFIFLLIFIISPLIRFDYLLITNPSKAPLAPEDRQQLFEDWSSGIGNKEVAQKIKEISSNKKVAIFTENASDQYWVFSYLYDTGNALIIPSDNLIENKFIEESQIPKDVEEIYIVLSRNPNASNNWPVDLVYSVSRGSHRTINLYKVNK